MEASKSTNGGNDEHHRSVEKVTHNLTVQNFFFFFLLGFDTQRRENCRRSFYEYQEKRKKDKQSKVFL
jgi:hypothetical protein